MPAVFMALLATASCAKGTSGTAPSADGGTSEACVHVLKDLPEAQREGTVAAATSSAMTKMQEGGKPLVDCPLDGTPVTPKVIFASCGGTRSVSWSGSAGGASATSYFGVSGKLSAYQESSGSGVASYTCGDGRTARVAVYGTVPTCQPWTEQRYCAPPAAP
jgi:hypothetical protein